MEAITPSGTAIKVANKVTIKDPIISGKIPKVGGSYVGYHSCPKRKSFTDTLLNKGSPSRKRDRTIIASTKIETREKGKTIFNDDFLSRSGHTQSPTRFLLLNQLLPHD